MAFIDAALDTIVIRIVYDGPPLAGKTTSVRALAGGMGSTAQSPAELDGRTVYFDWLEYTGGLFEGRRIRCQIVSVPGQTMLASRRRYLLESADSVVFVSDSAVASTAAMVIYLRALRTVLANGTLPPVGIVVQANRRDRPDVVPIARLRDALNDSQLQVGVIESIATEGAGVRETFIFAVRLALDRVRELMQRSALQSLRPRINSAQDLLADMKAREGTALALATASGLTLMRPIAGAPSAPAMHALVEATEQERVGSGRLLPPVSGPHDAPRLPDSRLPSGMIWPPVNGRLILDEAAQGTIALENSTSDHWVAHAPGGYVFQSPSHARYAQLDQGRSALIQWARMHAASTRVISPYRCIVLAEDGMAHYRLWQVVRTETSLRDALNEAMRPGVDPIAAAMLNVCEQLVQAAEEWSHAACALPLSLSLIGTATHRCRYLGRMPLPEHAEPAKPFSAEQMFQALIAHDLHLGAHIAPRDRLALARALHQVGERGARDGSRPLLQRYAKHFAATLGEADREQS